MSAKEASRFTSSSPSDARRRVAAEIGDCPAALEATELLVSELVTNALTHTGDAEIPVSVEHLDRRIMVSVSDSSSEVPAPRQTDVTTPGGLGLRLVDRLADDWGVEQHPDDGKSVWFTIRCTGPRDAG